MFGFTALSAFKLQRELEQMEKTKKRVQNVREEDSRFGA
jgi:hypothetical protein